MRESSMPNNRLLGIAKSNLHPEGVIEPSGC
jgi:hypothetical protein